MTDDLVKRLRANDRRIAEVWRASSDLRTDYKRRKSSYAEAADRIEALEKAMRAASLKAREATGRYTRSKNAHIAGQAADILDAALKQPEPGQEEDDEN